MKQKQIHTILMVKNIEVSKRFYADVLKLDILQDWGAMVIFEDNLSLHQADQLQPFDITGKIVQAGAQGRSNVVIYIQSDNLDECFESLKAAGVPIEHGIIQLPWERVFRAYDPDGYVLEIGEPH